MTTEIVFTPIPCTTEDGPHVSVLVTLRLDPGPTPRTLGELGGFPWPELLADLTFGLEVSGASTPLPTKWDPGVLRPGMWQALMPKDTLVKAWDVLAEAEDHALRPIKTYGVRAALQQVHGLYEQLAGEAGAQFPPRNHPAIAPLNRVRERFLPGRHKRHGEDGGGGHISDDEIASGVAADGQGWAMVLRDVTEFYDAGFTNTLDATSRQYDQDAEPLPSPPTARPEFHERVSMISHHTSLLRPLGLVIDLRFDVGLLPPTGTMRVVVGDVHGVHPRCPATRFVHHGRGLWPAAGTGDVHDGLLSLGHERYVVYQTDLDGSLLKLAGRAHEPGFTPEERAEARAIALEDEADERGVVDAAETPESLPALRTGAITVARDRRSAELTASFTRARELAKAAPGGATDVLDADDLYQGYRIDVEVEGDGTWFSLCQRREEGRVGDEPWPAGDAEGFVSEPGGTSPPVDGPPADRPLRVHEALFSWDGWSLVAPRPGRVIDDLPREVSDVGPLELAVDIRVTPGTLRRLRYGTSYRLRARAVDLAGNSLPPRAPSTEAHATRPLTYLRYEPVPSPVLGPLTHFTEGESLEHLVIRSEGGLDQPSAATYAAASPPERLYAATNHRHVAPPKTTQTAAELHGMLDPFDRATAFRVSTVELGAPGDTFVIDPWKGSYAKLKTGEVAILGPGRTSKPARELADGNLSGGTYPFIPEKFTELLVEPGPAGKPVPWRGRPLEEGEFLAWPERMPVSWLPDPMVEGVRLRHDKHEVVARYDVAPRWPSLQPLRLTLEQGPSVKFRVEDQTIHVTLPPATIWTCRISSSVDSKRLPHHAWWVAAGAGSDGRRDLEAGRHWMVTPWREVTFVHAVQRPVKAPTATDRDAWQRVNLGDTFAVIAGPITVDGPSTGHLDLYAEWSDPVDNLADPDAKPDRQRSQHGGHVAQLPVDYTVPLVLPGPVGKTVPRTAIRHELGDTKHHEITYRFVATTRYREYFAPEITANPDNLTTLGLVMKEWTIKSSARPAAPGVLYVVPTFRWEPQADGEHQHRTGRGLRVWLERPWWSSGDGELLGVVVTGDRDDRKLLSHVTQWGADPRFEDDAPGRLPTVDAFPNATQVSDWLEVPEASGQARVAGFLPHFDGDRKLWYVDLDIETGAAETPFVSLALCRWQPDSLEGVELSAVVRADFVQVLPDRGASIAWADRSASVTVTMAHPPMPQTWRDPLLPHRFDDLHLAPRDVLVEAIAGLARPSTDAMMHVRPSDAPGHLHPGRFVSWVGWLSHHVTEAELQARPRSAADDDLAWGRVGPAKPTDLPPRMNPATGERQWHGTIEWGQLDPDHEYRVLIRQYELLTPDPAAGPAGVLPHDRRIMFAAIFVLDRR